MNNELIQTTGFFDVESVPNQNITQAAFNWDQTFAETKELVKEDAELTATIDDALVKRIHVRVQIGYNLMALQKEHAKAGHGDFTTVEVPKLGIADNTFVYRCINAAKLDIKLGGISSFASLQKMNIFDVPMPLDTWNKLASRSGQTVVRQLESGEIKPTQADITKALDEERARLAEEKRRNEELQEAKQELQRSFDLFKNDREKERQELKNKLQAIEHEKAVKDDEILSYKQSQAALGDKARLNAKEIAQLQENLRSEARKQLDKDLEKQRQEQKTKFKEAEKELKALYAQKEQQYQLKAENTIRSLLSHGIKSMAETQLTIEHTVSAGMLQAVQQLGGKQVDSFLAQAESLQEEIDRVIAKLTHGDYLALEERVGTNG